MTGRERRRLEARWAVERWNACVPVGTLVRVTRDDGRHLARMTRSEAWLVGDDTPVILLDGIRGAYLLDRCTPLLRTLSS